MSATLHIPSSAGGIVVDGDGTFHQEVTEVSPDGGTVVSAAPNLTGSVINLATNEIIAAPQIIKLVTDDEHQQIVGQDVRTSQSQSQSGSKVHVISNVTLVSKSPSTQTINFVNTTSKSLNTSANSGYINAFVSKGIPPSGKIVNLVNPIKGNAPKATPIVQKVSVPRNVQVLTRVQTLTHATLGGNIIMSRLTQPQQFPATKQTKPPYKAPKIVAGAPQQQQVFQPGMKIYTGSVAGQKVAQSVKTVTKAQPLKAAAAPPMGKMMKQVFSNTSAPNLATITQQYPPTNMSKNPGIQLQSNVPVKFNNITPTQQMASTARTLTNMGNLVIQSNAQKVVKSNKVIQVQAPLVPQPPAPIKMIQNVTTVPSFNIIQGGTIKYVNAQGNVTQPPATKIRSQQTFDAPPEVSSNTTVDDMMYVNGMSMDEEMSARILQSLSQKAVINNNRYVQQQKYLITPNTDQTYAQYPPNQEVKHGPEYFRVNTSDLQTTTTTFIDNIPLVATNEEYYQRDQAYDQDDYTDGEEQITAKDTKLIMQHPALQDHTYAAPMPEGMATQEAQTENYAASTAANSTEAGIAHILLGYSCNQQKQDDDNASVISNDSRNGKNALDVDLGEETETAPEGEGEDDSVTRCICDLTHDDGYMICCDKCSAWQHVDCMGIDRQNIPDEYNCEMCQPRSVDKARARNLQLIKRKEQQALMMFNTLPQQPIPMDIIGPPMEVQQRVPLNALSPTTKKPRNVRKKGEGFAAKRQKRESRANGKRKETKKPTKRKGKQQQVENGGGGSGGEKNVMNLRTWIENYEQAVTNHYSPELRARLQALGKQQSAQQLNSHHNLRNVGNLDGKCGTVPHAGGKILISSMEMSPNTPIVEIRGKYMLSGQYRQQLITSTRNYGLNRNPGPFIFFYRLPNDGPEICVDTRTYGNEARFVRRSCRPNAEVVHFIEKGTIHLYIVSMLNIKESTEITIRHEPHDLLGVTQGNVPAPTSTVCACGLTKDCLFPNSGAPPLPQPAGGGPKGKRVNGTYHKVPKEGGYKRTKTLSRNRSTSSSGESNVLSPNGFAQISTTALAPPSIQPQLLEAAAAALSAPQTNLPPTVTQMMNYPPSPTRNHLNISAASSATTMSVPGTPTLLSPNEAPPQKETIVLSPVIPPVVVAAAAAAAPESPIKTPQPLVTPEEPPQVPPQAPPPPPPVAPPTPPKAQTKRVPKPKVAAVVSAPTTPTQEEVKTPVKKEEDKGELKDTTEGRKLTREERKMEAILKAFEKMEKTSQRKQELKQQKTTDKATTSMTRRRSSFSPFGGQKIIEERVVNNHQKKKKRKGSKSYQQTTTQRKRRRSRVNSNESDNATSEESGAMLSPPLPGAALYRNSEPVPQDMLLPEMQPLHIVADAATDAAQTGFHSSPLSSVCMLVEAAVAPLENQCVENDFKLPHKTKTKKTIMNEWLNQADAYPPAKNLETLVQAAAIQQHYRPIQEEPQNLSMMAKKVEEFITLTDTKVEVATSEDDERGQIEEVVLHVPPPLPTPPTAGGSESAVKKRWLRQAISEECIDEMVPSPPNGFTTPLKKRRFTRQYSDLPEDLSPTQATCHLPQEDPIKEVPEVVEVKEIKCETPIETIMEVMKTEITDAEDIKIEVKEDAQIIKEEVTKIDEEQVKSEVNDIEPEAFDIEPLEPLNKVKCLKEDDGNLADIEDVNSDEIADLQEKIHSFHAENILILKSRNRKTKQRASSEEKCDRKILRVRKKRLSSDPEDLPKKKIKSRSSSPALKVEDAVKEEGTDQTPIPQPSGALHELPASFNSSIPPPTSVTTYSSYVLNNATNLMSGAPPPTTFGIPPIFGTFPPQQMPQQIVDEFHPVMGIGPNVSVPPPPPSLSDYMEKPTTFRDIFAQSSAPQTRPPYFATLNTPQPVPPPAVPPVTPTGFLPKATFTTLDPIPTVAAPTPRIYQRAASADPRLNPNISVPEPPPAPKRKLSITEYRKRKQQSTDSTSAMDMKSPSDADLLKDLEADYINSKADGLSDFKDDSSSSASATKTPSTPEENVPFSPTPTLLELQQESLSERLKNYKSLQELSGTLPDRDSIEDVPEENPNVSSTTCDSVTSSTVTAPVTAPAERASVEEKIPECDDTQEISTTSGVTDENPQDSGEPPKE